MAVASLVLGILACMLFWIFPVCAIFGAVAFVLGRVAQRRFDEMPAEHRSRSGKNARGWATAGIVLAVSGIFLSGVLLGSCYCMVQDAAKQGQEKYNNEIRGLEDDPDLRKQLDELKKDLKQLDEQRPDAEKKLEDKGSVPKKDTVKEKPAGEE